MRDERPLAGMTPAELRAELVNTSQQLAAWAYSLADRRREGLRPYLEAYEAAQARSVAERVKEAEMATCTDRQQIIEAEGHVAFHTAMRDCIVELLRHPEHPMMLLTEGATNIPTAVVPTSGPAPVISPSTG